MPYLAKIIIYPIKSLDGITVENATILPSGALKGDRQFAIIDEQGNFVNAKRHAKIHLLRSEFNLESRHIYLQLPNSTSTQEFHLDKERQALAETLSNFFGFKVTLQQNTKMGFPDDTNSPGPTVISTATLTEVASWFPSMSVEEIRRRIRANIEIDGVPAFWEDQLFTASDEETGSFSVGDVSFFGINPCQRCVVPTRDSHSGTAYPNFQKIFAQKRQATMPTWVETSRFKHFYSLSVNTRLPASQAGKVLQIGNKIEII
ncbi:MAG TPA: MOSC N-terminal beta barrel domain-containing protein [Nostocaceae cyanobacterium]|nr:MOSC N-terminal beta barrel domain-containing protein [Nostocaceae cyanobacterium]